MNQVGKVAALFLPLLLLGPAGQAAEPPVPDIPGITTADRFPGACVDCHVNRPDIKKDFRLSAHMRDWQAGADPHMMAKLRAIGDAAANLTGRHPAVPAEGFNNVPGSCISCHAKPESQTVPLDRIAHVLHLTGGKENHFITQFAGQCTACHKLDRRAGVWSIPSGPEKQ